MKLTNNFNLSEFDCNDGTPVPAELIPNAQELANNIQVLRDFLGCRIKINSGYRTEKYNSLIGGASKSMHLKCKAGDLSTYKFTPSQVYAAIKKLIRDGRMRDGGIGRYNGFTHYDIGSPREWDLRTVKN